MKKNGDYKYFTQIYNKEQKYMVDETVSMPTY